MERFPEVSYFHEKDYNSLITLQGFPTAIQFAGIDRVTTLPALMVLPSPIMTPGNMIEPLPIQTFFPISTDELCDFQKVLFPDNRSAGFIG